jgi:hypothetical protein
MMTEATPHQQILMVGILCMGFFYVESRCLLTLMIICVA